MSDLDILTILSNKINYNKYSKYIKDYNIQPETKVLLADYKQWWKDDKTRENINWSGFTVWFKHVAHPMVRSDQAEIYDGILSRLSTHKVDSTLEDTIIKSFIARDYATRIADTALRVSEGDSKASLEDISGLVTTYRTEVGKSAEIDSYFVTEDLDEVLDSTIGAGGLNWRLDELNKSVGPLRKGNLVLFGARPDAGKTTMLASEATFMAPQLEEDQVILWINNEEAGASVRSRIIQAGVGWNMKKLNGDRKKAWAEYKRLVGAGRIKLVDKTTINVGEIGELLSRMNVGLLIFDQLWKVHGFEKEAALEVQRQAMLFSQAREWAKDHCPVLLVHQADGSAEGERFITMNQLYGSKTAIQGECDAIITLGRTTEAGYENSRFIYVPKNKLPGGVKSESAFRNGKFEVLLKGELARFV